MQDVRVLVLFDLDGTILSTARAGIGALEDAAGRVLGTALDLSQLETAGWTDPMIARAIVERVLGRSDPKLERLLLDSYVEALPRRLGDRQGRVMPNVKECLTTLTAVEPARVGLLTGNMAGGAAAKLAHYGVHHRFDVCGFGEDGFTRPEIGHTLLARCRCLGIEPGTVDVVLVGDTPFDVEAGRQLGMKTLAVATGSHAASTLRRSRPWRVAESLPEPSVLLDWLGLA